MSQTIIKSEATFTVGGKAHKKEAVITYWQQPEIGRVIAKEWALS